MGIAPRALPQSTMSQTIIKDAVFFNLPFSTLERTVKSLNRQGSDAAGSQRPPKIRSKTLFRRPSIVDKLGLRECITGADPAKMRIRPVHGQHHIQPHGQLAAPCDFGQRAMVTHAGGDAVAARTRDIDRRLPSLAAPGRTAGGKTAPLPPRGTSVSPVRACTCPVTCPVWSSSSR